MKIPSKDVIQADSPEQVMMTIDAVARGARNDTEIAAAIGDLDARQGRYYRLAAEVLGFMVRDGRHQSIATPAGQEFANAQTSVKRELFIRAVVGSPSFQRLFPFLESKGSNGATRADLRRFLGQVAELGAESTVKRRVSTYVGWLLKLGLGTMVNDRLVLGQLPAAVPLVRYGSDDEPMFPNRYELEEYAEQERRVASRREAVAYYVDQASHERAVSSHEMLVNLMAERLRQRGLVPKANRYVDLSARWQADDFLFEMKSTTDENLHGQVRRGLSQLYEYRYIQNVPAAKLVLVLENPLPRKLSWMGDYLTKDRGILLVWDGSGSFYCPEDAKRELPFLE